MIQQIFCFNCGDGGPMPATIRYRYRVDTCGQCYHRDKHEYNYYFCSLNCMVVYVAKFADGLPCASCNSTGFAFSFKENGNCVQCGGRGRVPQELAQAFSGLTTEKEQQG